MVSVLLGQKVKWNNYVHYVDRVSSFEAWPQQMSQDKFALAQAGFIYMKNGDIVECFACCVKVSQWAANDIPLTEHKKWSPDCVYLKLIGSSDTRAQRPGCGAFSSVFDDI